jgi:hypothetical protein
MPLSLVGALWFPAILEYNLSIAVWVWLITVASTEAESPMSQR